MVNPSLKSSDEPIYSTTREYRSTTSSQPHVPKFQRQKKTQEKKTDKQKPAKRKVIYLADDEDSSGLVVDINPDSSKVKRKYTRRKKRDVPPAITKEGECSSSSSCASSVVEKEDAAKPVVNTPLPTEEQPRVKRKYIKRKLVRKKYTRKAPKNQCCEPTKEEVVMKEEVLGSNKNSDSVDLWVELVNDNEFCQSIEMMTDDVDSFWESVEDPNNLFVDLEVELRQE